MKRTATGVAVLLALVLAGTAPVHPAGHGQKRAKKVGILLVAFGSSEHSAQVSFENIDAKVRAAYPGTAVRWAYTSTIIRK